jgi:hypothetical protein
MLLDSDKIMLVITKVETENSGQSQKMFDPIGGNYIEINPFVHYRRDLRL